MATLQKIRNRAGILIAVVIGIALLAFILGDFMSSGRVAFRRAQMTIAKINGVSVYVQEYDALMQSISSFYQSYYGQSYNDENSIQQVRIQTWEELKKIYILNKEYEKIGLAVHPEELFEIVSGADPHPIVRNFFTNPETNQVDQRALLQFLKAVTSDEIDEKQKKIWVYLENEIYKDRFRTKFNTLFNKGIYATKLEARKNYIGNNTKVSFSYISKPFSSIPDSLIKITSKYIEDYYDKHINDYFNEEETRTIEYVVFDIIPSAEDDNAAKKWINDIYTDFKEIDDIEHFVNANSDVKYNPTNYTKDELPELYRDTLFDAKVGKMFGPYFENGSYKLAKLAKINYLPDSVRARHILIAANQNTPYDQIKTKADSLMKLIENGFPFGLLAEQNSDDKTSADVGGDMGWFTEGKMVKPFNDTCFYGKKGDLKQVNSQFGIHIVEITDQSRKVKKVQIGLIERKVTPSDVTINQYYSQAGRFAGENNTYSKFSAAVKNNPEIVSREATIKKGDLNIPGLTASRPIIRWAFLSNENEVSQDVFEINDSYIVAAVKKIKEKGEIPLEEVKEDINMHVVKNKKGEELKKQMKDIIASDNSFESIAEKLNEDIVDAGQINLGNQFPMIRNAGLEPKVIGVISTVEDGNIAGPIIGNNGVYIIKVENIEAVTEVSDAEIRFSKMQLYRNIGLSNEAPIALDKQATIKDNRINFF